jgi:dihydroorotate dehydrogenase (fumarate)
MRQAYRERRDRMVEWLNAIPGVTCARPAGAFYLSDSSELLPRLHWLAILSPLITASLAVTGGVHDAVDALKATMAGAQGIQLVSTVLKKGPGQFDTIRRGMAQWLEEHEYTSLSQARGSMNLARTPDPGAYERLNYMRLLLSYEDRL